MIRVLLFMLLLILLPVLNGCQGREINSTTATMGLGVDLAGDQVKMSIQLAKPMAPQNASEEPSFVVTSSTGPTFSDAARKIYLKTPRYTLWSHSSVFLLGENLARKDLSLIMDTLSRNVDIRKSSLIFVTQGYSPEQLLQAQSPLEPTSSQGIKNLLELQEKQLGIYVGIHVGEFINILSTSGIEPLVPQVTLAKQGEKMVPTLNGAAVFKGKKMVGSLNEDETRGYRFLQEGLKQGGLIIIPCPLNQNKKVTLEILRCQTKSQAQVSGDNVRMQIEIDVEGNFYEQNSTGKLLTLENIKVMEQLANEEIRRQCNACITRAQSLNSDILGWGRKLENTHPKTFNRLISRWNEIFPQIEADIKVNFSIRRTYLTDRSFEFR